MYNGFGGFQLWHPHHRGAAELQPATTKTAAADNRLLGLIDRKRLPTYDRLRSCIPLQKREEVEQLTVGQ